MEESSLLFKIVLMGNAGVGKTCLVRQFTQGKFPARSGATIGVDFLLKPMLVNDQKVNLQIWDTAGQERFRSITQSYYRSAHCLVLVYDISSKASFDSLQQWCRDIEHFTGASATGSASNAANPVLRVLVGNKCDVEPREIAAEFGETFARTNAFDMFRETCALAHDTVERLFAEIADTLVRRKNRGNSIQAPPTDTHAGYSGGLNRFAGGGGGGGRFSSLHSRLLAIASFGSGTRKDDAGHQDPRTGAATDDRARAILSGSGGGAGATPHCCSTG